MNKIYLIAIFIYFSIAALAQEKKVQVSSTITNVTVFLSGAQVNRQSGFIDIPQGVSLLSFSSLSSAIEAQSIQAKGEGNFTILSVTQQKDFLAEKKNSEEKLTYINAIADLQEKISVLNNEIAVNKAEEEMLTKNQVVMGPNVNYDLAKFKLALDFHKQRLTEAKNKQIDINKTILKLQQDLVKYNAQLNEVNGKSLKNTNDIIVKVSSKTATKGKFALTYLVNNAGWYPTYDVRAKDVSSPIELVYKANVTQNSGEDWKNVKLTLSSGNPSINNVKPTLLPYNLGFLSAGYYGTGGSSAIKLVTGRVTSADDGQALPGVAVRVKNSSVGTTTDAVGNFSIQIPEGSNLLSFSYIGFKYLEQPITSSQMNLRLQPDEQMLMEVAVVGYGNSKRSQPKAEYAASTTKIKGAALTTNALEVSTVEKQTNVTFDIQNPYTILSDGKQATVDIGNYNFDADYEYYAAPKITEDAFLTAKINGFNEINLISGEANIFFEGTFLGKTLIDVQTSLDTLTFSLGVDKNVVIKREKQNDYNEKQFIGSSQRDNKHFIIDIKNRKAQAINLTIEDQLPVSTSSDITVEKQEISNANYSDVDGKLVWKFKMQPNEQKKLALKYQVKYPKNRPINLE